MTAERRILISSGEPAGIGPDLCVLLAQQALPCRWAVAADPTLLAERAQSLGVALTLRTVTTAADWAVHTPGVLQVLAVPTPVKPVCGRLATGNAAYVLALLDSGIDACLAGHVDALVTAPVHKGVINDAGFAFSGHTEYIAARTGGQPVMLLATAGLRVALVTTHLPLKDVSAAITPARLTAVIRVLHQDLRQRFGIATPRILVCGLNPHAGEGGHLGREELEVITPVLTALREEGMVLDGPLPADTLFLPKYLEQADAVLAMYHDQGLPVLKHKGFGRAVNITLGLPLVRTSVDHGTALDLAGTGRIDIGSLQAAFHAALEMCQGVAESQSVSV